MCFPLTTAKFFQFLALYNILLYYCKKKIHNLKDILGSSHCGAVEANPASIHDDVGLVPGLSQ